MNITIRQALFILIFVFWAMSCTVLAPVFTREKQRTAFQDNEIEKQAHRYFWNKLHLGHYDSLPEVLDKLHGAYQNDPGDFKLAAHLGFAYAWKFTERRRDTSLTPSIAGDGDLALTYFDEAVKLNPKDPRILGFKAGFMLANADRHNDPELQVKGYFLGKKSIRQWPSFNLFSIGYVMSGIEHEKDRYGEAVEFQWKNLEACLCRSVDRNHPNLTDIDQIPTRVADDKKKSRACTNGWIAPHNVEGFLLNLGDMLVKQGELPAAREIYHSIRRVKEYEEWPYKKYLNKRLENLEANVAMFRRPSQTLADNRQVFIRTTIGCMGCHQKSEKEFAEQNGTIPLDYRTYFLDK